MKQINNRKDEETNFEKEFNKIEEKMCQQHLKPNCLAAIYV